MVADENSKVRNQLKVAGKRLMDVLEQFGEDGADGPVALLGISGLLPSVLQGQAQYGQIVVSSLKLDPIVQPGSNHAAMLPISASA